MIRLRWLLLLLALSTLFATWRVWWGAETRSPDSLLEAAESRLESHGFDHHVALRELNLSLSMAEENGDRVTAEKALRSRAEVNREGRAYFLVLQDCDRLLRGYCPNDPDVLSMAAQAAFDLGELDLAADYANYLVEVLPDDPESHNLVATVHRALAEEALGEIFEHLDDYLPTRLANQGLVSARQAAALPPNDPHSRSALEQLDGLASNKEERETQRALALRAAAHYRAARKAWLAGLGVKRTGAAIQGLQEILARADHPEEVIELGRACLRKPRFRDAGSVLVRTVLAQAKIGQVEDARKLISETKAAWDKVLQPARLDDETIVPWMALLHELELWPELKETVDVVNTRKRLIERDKALQATLPYLRGVALFEQNRVQASMPSLTRAGRYTDASEVIKGEQVLSWSVRATAERRMAMREEEQRSLMEVTHVRAIPDPDGSRAARAFGEALERQSRLEERKQKYVPALEALARATAYLPERREEFEGRWRRLGELQLEAEGQTLQELDQLFGLLQKSTPGTALNSWVTVELAQKALERGQAAKATNLVRTVVRDLPFFPPLLQVSGEAFAANENWSRAVSSWLTLGRLFGYTPKLGEQLSRVPRNRFPTPDLIEWAALDPRRALLGGMVRDLVDQGQTDLALQAIRYLGGAGATSQEILLAAQISARDRDWRGAFKSVEQIPNDDPVFPEAAALLIRSATEVGDPTSPTGPLLTSLSKVYGAKTLDSKGFPEAVDALMARGLALEAGTLCRLLDQRESTRDAALILRRAVTEVCLGNATEAESALDRAAAFQKGPNIVIGRLLMAIDQQDPKAIADHAFQLIVGPYKENELREGIARALYGDLERALPALAAADQAHDGLQFTAHLAFLTGLAMASDDAPNDSIGDNQLNQELTIWRQELASLPKGLGLQKVLALLLAISTEAWEGWASTRLAQAAPALASHPWAVLLSAETAASLGRLDQAKALALPLTKPRIQLPWAWVLLEKIALERSGGEVNLEVVRARVGRVLDFGTRGLDPAQAPRLAAEALLFLGRSPAALRVLEFGLKQEQESGRDSPDLLTSLARVANIAGKPKRSLWAYDQLLHSRDRESIRPLVPEILELLKGLHSSRQLTNSGYFARIQSLAARFPRDPAPVRDLARCLLQSGESLSTSPVSRALARLDRFRSDTNNVPLESLRSGEATRWVQLISDLDPQAAEDLAHKELLASPYSIQLWRTWADTLRGMRRYDKALGVYRTLAAVVPDTSSMKSLAQVLLEQKEDPLLALTAAKQARSRLGNAAPDPELALIEAIAKTYTSEAGYKAGIKELRSLLRQARQKDFPLEIWQVAKPLVEILCARGRRPDLKLASTISQQAAILVEKTDDLRADWFRAMGYVAVQNLN